MDAAFRVRTCRLIEQMDRRPAYAERLGLEDVSVFGEKNSRPGDRITSPPAEKTALKKLFTRRDDKVRKREKGGGP